MTYIDWRLLCRSVSNLFTSTPQLPTCLSISVYLSIHCLPRDWCLTVHMHSCLPCDFGCWPGSCMRTQKDIFVKGHFSTISYIPCSIAASTLKCSSVTVSKLNIARRISTRWLTLPPFNCVTLSNICEDLCVTRLKPHSNELLRSKGYYVDSTLLHLSACTVNLFLIKPVLNFHTWH